MGLHGLLSCEYILDLRCIDLCKVIAYMCVVIYIQFPLNQSEMILSVRISVENVWN
jgi:hypothetical protein